MDQQLAGYGFESGIQLSGLLIASIKVDPKDFDKVKITGAEILEFNSKEGFIKVCRKNAFVNIGLNNALDRTFGLASPAVPSHIGLSDDNTAVTATTTLLDPTPTGLSPAIKVFSPASSRAAQVVTAGATFTQADVNFIIRKVGLLNGATDAGTGLYDVIGGSGASPYNQPFTIDLTGTTSFSLTMQIQVTAAAS